MGRSIACYEPRRARTGGLRPAAPEGSVRIVDPQSGLACPERSIGEIWARGPMIGQGYWQKPEETREAFAAQTVDGGEGPLLRTGDLGFLDGGELFITGRLKDLIIIRGRNHYPHDIERTVQQSHAALKAGLGAAFSINGERGERLVIVQELERTQRGVEPQPVIDAIRQAVATDHELPVGTVVLLKPGQILRTSSGKIRRGACRTAFLENQLDTLARWDQPAEPVSPAPATVVAASAGQTLDADQIEELIVTQLASALNVSADDIDPAETFARYGLDSAGAVGLAASLETALGRGLPATLFYDYPSARDLSLHLAFQAASATTSGTGASEKS